MSWLWQTVLRWTFYIQKFAPANSILPFYPSFIIFLKNSFSWYHIPFLQGTQSVCNYSFNCVALSWKPPSYWTLSGQPGRFWPSILFTGSPGTGNLGEWSADWGTYRAAARHPLHALHLGTQSWQGLTSWRKKASVCYLQGGDKRLHLH